MTCNLYADVAAEYFVSRWRGLAAAWVGGGVGWRRRGLAAAWGGGDDCALIDAA